MTAEGWIDYMGLSEHPDAGRAALDLQDEFACAGESFVAEWASKDALVRAMLHPDYRPREWVSCTVDVLRPGFTVSLAARKVEPYGTRYGGIATVTSLRPPMYDHPTMVHVDWGEPNRGHHSRSTMWEWTDADRLLVPVPIDLTTLAATR